MRWTFSGREPMPLDAPDLSDEKAVIEVIGRRATEWMIETPAPGPGKATGSNRGTSGQPSVPVRFRCREHYLVHCERCAARP